MSFLFHYYAEIINTQNGGVPNWCGDGSIVSHTLPAQNSGFLPEVRAVIIKAAGRDGLADGEMLALKSLTLIHKW
jgi:hypothetical protein